MPKKLKIGLMILFIFICLMTSGCKLDFKQLLEKTQPAEPEMLNVEIHFTNTYVMYGYVKKMGIEDDGEVYSGGSSLSYVYDQQGKVIGSFNYAQVSYMKLIP